MILVSYAIIPSACVRISIRKINGIGKGWGVVEMDFSDFDKIEL